ncbi:MAG: hypothetical protein JSS91_07055 [Bacteroidetes bacterium]|nr:hypothetical protein [Bacteroidota bacterium]
MKSLKSLSIKILALTLFSVICISCSGASPELVQYRSELKDQMQEMINVLNGAHYTEFMENYVEPSYITKAGGLDQAMLQFGNTKQNQIRKALQAARNIEPLFNQNKKVMTYVGNALPIPLTFKQISGKWYLTGDWFENN